MKKVDVLIAVLFWTGVTCLLAAGMSWVLQMGAATPEDDTGPANTEITAPPTRDVASVCEETAAGIEFFLALEKRPSASWTRWVVIDGHCYVSNWDEVWTCDEAEKMLTELQAKHLGAK